MVKRERVGDQSGTHQDWENGRGEETTGRDGEEPGGWGGGGGGGDGRHTEGYPDGMKSELEFGIRSRVRILG